MTPIKFKFLKSYNSLIILLISILGFSTSCENDEPLVMYGSPNATFIVKGKIESAETNNLIPDIIVEMREVFEQEGSMLTATGFSRFNGEYIVDMIASPKDLTLQLKFTDTDGALNGEYESLDTTIVFQDPKFTNGDGSWYRGFAEKELNIKLKPKQ